MYKSIAPILIVLEAQNTRTQSKFSIFIMMTLIGTDNDFKISKVFYFDMHPPGSKEILFFNTNQVANLYWIRNRNDPIH